MKINLSSLSLNSLISYILLMKMMFLFLNYNFWLKLPMVLKNKNETCYLTSSQKPVNQMLETMFLEISSQVSGNEKLLVNLLSQVSQWLKDAPMNQVFLSCSHNSKNQRVVTITSPLSSSQTTSKKSTTKPGNLPAFDGD